MKYTQIFFCIILISACSQSPSSKLVIDKKSTNTSTKTMLGERINGPANVRDTVDGKILFSLNDNVLVETGETKNDWLEIGIFLKLTTMQLTESKILPNTDLIALNGEIIGKSIDTLSIGMCMNKEGQIYGFTHKNNIKLKSIPENCLSEYIIQGKLNKSELEPFITNFSFEKYEYGVLQNLDQYMIYESTVIDPSPRDRITLLFKANKLLGIVHSRELKSGKFSTYQLVRGHKLTITSNLQKDEIQAIIKKQVEFLNSID